VNYYWKASGPAHVEFAFGGRVSVNELRNHPAIHVCKIDKGVCSWAGSPASVLPVCRHHADDKVIVDNAGREYTGDEFLKQLDGMYVDPTRVGTVFS
jgi:hypothetical protein